MRVGKVIGRFKMGKHFKITITDDSLSYERRTEKIAQEESFDGIYVIRTSVTKEQLSAEQTVKAYKSLSQVERVFRSYKTVDLKVRPIYHWLADRVKAHVFLCMLAYYVEWHMRRALAPILFDDDDKEAAQRSAKAKDQSKRTEDGMPVHSFQTLFADLATIVKNTVQPAVPGAPSFEKITIPTPIQKHVFKLLGVRLKVFSNGLNNSLGIIFKLWV
jgi:transposase